MADPAAYVAARFSSITGSEISETEPWEGYLGTRYSARPGDDGDGLTVVGTYLFPSGH